MTSDNYINNRLNNNFENDHLLLHVEKFTGTRRKNISYAYAQNFLGKALIIILLMTVGYTAGWAQTPPFTLTTEDQVTAGTETLYYIESFDATGFFMIPKDITIEDKEVSTSNMPNEKMWWYFMDAGMTGDVQYYYIVNKSSGKYLRRKGNNGADNSIGLATKTSANDASCKFFITGVTGSEGLWFIQPAANYYVNKKGTNVNYTNGLKSSSYNDDPSKWKFKAKDAVNWAHPFTNSTIEGDKHYYFIQNKSNTSYAISIHKPSDTDYASVSTDRNNNSVWYFVEAASDANIPNLKYYYIVNALSRNYMYFNSNTLNGNQLKNNANAFDVRAWTSGGENEDRYQFAIVNAKGNNYAAFTIVPKKLLGLYNDTYNAVGVELKENNHLGTLKDRGSNTNIAHWTFEVCTEFPLRCATPTITYDSSTGKITITTTPAAAAIHYTTDGTTEPSATEGTLYGGAFAVSGPTTIWAIATKDGYSASEIAKVSFPQVETPNIQNNGDNTISITCATSGADIYYTTDGNTPTTSSTKYTAPLGWEFSGKTIKAIAVKSGSINSAVATGSVTLKCATPIFTKIGNSLSISCAFPTTANIFYTTNGDEPTSSSEPYDGAITVSVGNVIKAIAIAEGFNNSDVATKTIRQELTPNSDGNYPINSQQDFETFIDMASNEESASYHYVLNTDVTAGSEITIPFSGTFDGGLHTISGLSHALFNSINGGTVKDVILNNINVSTSNVNGNAGAIANEANGASRIYNVGILSGSVSGSGKVGGIVGLLDGTSRVINCYSYANVSGGTDVGGIVGYNAFASTAANLQTMVMNCVFYGDITSGTNVSPIYGGLNIDNLHNGLNTYNYYAYSKAENFVNRTEGDTKKYNNALAVEDIYWNRFEFFRLLLNSNKKLAAYYITGDAADANIMAKWVLETADRNISGRDPYPYPILKAQGKYPSIINMDVEHAPDSTTVGRNKGGKLGKKLNVHISGTGITNQTIEIDRTDKDYDRFNFNYDKIQLPYYNDYGTENYKNNQVVTGWKITNITAVSGDPYSESNYAVPSSGTKNYPDFNFADRKSSNKDLYSVSHRVFSQGAYFDVPYGVTDIYIEPYWGTAAYVADEYLDVVYNSGYGVQNVTQLGKQFPTGKITINGSEQTVYTSISSALSQLSGATVYDNAVVLVGNLHQGDVPSNGDKAFTLMSVDLDNDHEPDYSMIYHHNNRQWVSPIRFDFLNIPGTAQAQKPNGASTLLNFTIFKMKGWFETTNTSLMYSNQIEYENTDGGSKAYAPLILLGGYWDQFVSTRATSVTGKTYYIHVGSNAYINSFGVGTHGDGNKATPHVPVSVTGGEYNGFYLSGTYNPNAATNANDHAECYISGGHFVEAAGASQEQINGNVHWQIYNADIDDFYGGGINSVKPILGTITTDIYYSHVGTFCGGPKFGNMQANKTVTTNALGCEFNEYFGAGYGGLSYSRQKYYDETSYNFNTYKNTYNGDFGKYYNGASTNANSSHADYGKKGKGVATDYDYEFFVWSTGLTGARFYIKFATFSLAQCEDVVSDLKNCVINKNFYGGGKLGNVSGKATSVLDACTVHGNVFGGGYSAEIPKIPVREDWFAKAPKLNDKTGMFEMASFPATKEYEWKHVESLPANGTAGTEDGKYVYTDVDLTALGKVGYTDLTVKGETLVEGKIFDADGNQLEQTGGVFGGGDMSAVNQNTKVRVQKADEGDQAPTVNNVFGGGNTADVGGDALVMMSDGTVSHDVYGGGKGHTTVVGGDVKVHIGKTFQEDGTTVDLTGTPTITGSLYGGSAFGAVNATKGTNYNTDHTDIDATSGGKETTVNIYAGTISESVYGGGKGQVEIGTSGQSNYQPAYAAQNFGNTTINMEGGSVSTAIYGGANTNGVLKQDATITIIGGTVGTAVDAGAAPADAVFGGGYGAPTLVEGNVTVNIGREKTGSETDHFGTATIHGNVYGGGALGSVNTSKPANDLVFDNTKITDVNLFKGTINGNVFGGGLGQKNGVNSATSDILSYVGGDVKVLLDGAKVTPTYTTGENPTPITGQIFGCNNLNGTPKGHVTVHIKRTVDSAKDENTARTSRTTYDVAAVYGGGNQADYIPTDATLDPEEEGKEEENKAKIAAACAEVIIEGCQKTSINYVYGGGNAAAVPATKVTVLGTYIINTLYGGGNGSDPNKPGADVGIIDPVAYASDKTTGIYGTGKAETMLFGGYINNVYGASNTRGDVRGGTDVRTKSKGESAPTGRDCCGELNVGKVYGAGSHADMDGDVNIVLECMPEDYVDQVFGGAEQATVNGNVSLVVTSGKFGRVFGGNNAGGDIHGSITVNVSEDGCKALMIGELYGGGNNAPYSIYGCTQDGNTWTANTSGTLYFDEEDKGRAAVEVYVFSCTSIGKIFGGGNNAEVIGNTRVWVNTWKGYINGVKQDNIGKIGQVFGGGNAAKVVGNTQVDVGTALANEGEDIGVNITKGTYTSSTVGTYISPTTNEFIDLEEAGIYGGGFSADVEGNTTLNIGTRNQNMGVNIAGNIFGGGYGETTHVTGNVTVNIGTVTAGDPVGYANITGDVYGGSAKGKVNSHLVSSVETATGGTTQVNFYGGTITGNLYGGGLGEDNTGTDSDHAADVYGPVTVTMEKGSSTNTVVNYVFGCNNYLGTPKNTVTVNINGGTVNHNVYGGGNQAAYEPAGSTVINYPAVSINNGTVTENVFGGGLGTTATVTGNPQVTIGDTDNTHTAAVGGSTYGGGDAGDVHGNPHVKVQNTNTTIAQNVFGGGKGRGDTFTCEKAMVGVNDEGACADPSSNDNKDKGTKVTILNGTIGTLINNNLVAGTGNVYGGGEIGRVEWNTQVKIGIGDGTCAPVIEGCVFGAGKGLETHGYSALVRGNSTVTIGGDSKIGKNVYGGGEIATVGRYWVKDIPTTTCTGETQPTAPATLPTGMPYQMRRGGICDVTIQDDADIGYHGVASDAGHVFAAGRGVNPEITEYQYHASGDNRSKRMVTYDSEKHTSGQGETWDYTDDTHAYVWEYFANENAYKQFLETMALVSRSTVKIDDCNIKGNVYGGSESGFVQTWTSVKILGNSVIGTSGSTTYGNVFGGGKGVPTFAEAGVVRGYTAVDISDGIIYGNVYGGGERGYVKQNVTVSVSGGEVKNDVYGGGALANTNTDNWNTSTDTWNVTDVEAQDYYEIVKHLTVGTSSVEGYYTDNTGGGIQGAGAKAEAGQTYYKKLSYNPNIYNLAKNGTTYKTTVNLTGGVIGNAYGGGLGQLGSDGTPDGTGNIKAMVYGDVAVNVNGAAFTALVEPSAKNAPVTGRVFGCNNVNGTPKGKVTVIINKTRRIDGGSHTLGEFEIQGVYGGGNLANYVPQTYDFATEFGQKAKVIINDCEASISKVYGGGNAAVVPITDVTVNGAFEIGYVFGGGNGGDMIYKNGNWIENTGADVTYYTNVLLKGGTIGQAFGGSDSRGTVYGGSDIKQETGGLCPLRLVNLYGAGNGEQASSAGDITVNVSGCGEYSEIQNVYGGSYKANITGSVTLNIKSGIFTSVFGGNDRRGSIGGNITVNIEETDDCEKPIIIQNLYGGCYQTAYPGESDPDNHTPAKDNNNQDFTTGKITVNVRSATRIDRIFGGSERGDVTGDTEVNINMVRGSMSGHNNVPLPSHYTTTSKPSNITVTTTSGYVTVYGLIAGESSVEGYYYTDVYTKAMGTAVADTKYYRLVPITFTAIPSAEITVGTTDVSSCYTYDGVSYTQASGTAVGGTTYYKATTYSYTQVPDGDITAGTTDVSSYYTHATVSHTLATGKALPGITYYKPSVKGNIAAGIGTIGNVYGGGNIGKVTGNTVVNIGTLQTVTMETVDDDPLTLDVNEKTPKVLGAHIEGDVFGGCNNATVTGDTEVNIGTADYSGEAYNNFEGIFIDKDANGGGSVFGGGNQGNVLGNTTVTMEGGHRTEDHDVYVFNGIFGGGYSGSVGTFTTSTLAADADVYGHTAHTGCIGKPISCATGTGKCTVVVTGGQIGPVDVAKDGMNRSEENGGPVPQGWVWGGGCGLIEDPAVEPDTHFKTYVGSTDVTIGGTAFVMEGVIGGGEFGRVLGNTLVKIQDQCQIGVGNTKWETVGGVDKPVRYTEEQWTAAETAVTSGVVSDINAAAAVMPECSHFPYGEDTNNDGVIDQHNCLPYDPYYDKYCAKDPSFATKHPELSPASTAHPSDGKTWIGVVFGGGSGYMPYEKADGSGYDWCRSAGWVEGNSEVRITGGHILTNVYGGNEITDVKGKSTVKMTGGTLGVPRTLDQIAKHPVTCYLFGAGKGDQRRYFNDLTNVGSAEVEVSGGIIYGSVFGGAEDGHVLGNVTMNIQNSVDDTDPENPVTISSPKIGTWGTSYVEGNIFGGGRGFSGETLGAGNVTGNIEVNISGGTMLGSIYGGGRMASVGTNFSSAQDPNTGQFIDGDGHGHITINISGGTIGNDRENSVIAANGHTTGGNVFGGCMGRLTLLNGNPNTLWTRLAQAKTSSINITGGTIKSNVYGGAEFGTTRDNVYVTIGGTRNESTGAITASGTPTINGHVYGGGYGSTIDDASYISNIDAGDTKYLFTPMQYAGIIGGETVVNILGGKVMRNVYGGGEMASVGIIDYSVQEDANGDVPYGGKKYSYINAHKHADIHDAGTAGAAGQTAEKVYGFGLSWPYKFEYVPTVKDGNSYKVGGKTTVNVSGGRIGTAWDNGTGYVFGGSKGQVAFKKKDKNGNLVDITDIHEQRYTEAFCANVRETAVNINYSSTPDISDPQSIGNDVNCIMGAVYGGGEDGHVMENAAITFSNGLTGLSVYGGGKGEGTYTGSKYVYNESTKEWDWTNNTVENIPSWTAGKVYGNTSITMSNGHVMGNIYGGGNLGSVGKGNYSGGTDDYYPAGYGETLTGNLWDNVSDNSKAFLSSGKCTINITGGTVGTLNGIYGTVGGTSNATPTGMVFGGSRGKAARDVGALSPRYYYAPEFFLGYANNTEVTIGTRNAATGPTIYSQVFGGGRDGHVRGSAKVEINAGTIGQEYDKAAENAGADADYQRYHRGNVYGSGSGLGTWDGTHHGQSSGSVTRNTTVDIYGGTIYNNVYGGGAMASVGPPRIPVNNVMPDFAPEDWSKCTVNIYGGVIGTVTDYEDHKYGGCVFGASRGGDFVVGETAATSESPDDYATTIWNEVNIMPHPTDRTKDAIIAGDVYGGGQASCVKKDNVVNLTGGIIKHDAYGGGKGTDVVAANVGGNTTVKLNNNNNGGEADGTKAGCSVSRIFGCNNLNGTPKGRVYVYVYATQHPNRTDHATIGSKYKKFDKISEYTIDNYSSHVGSNDYDNETLTSLATKVGINISVAPYDVLGRSPEEGASDEEKAALKTEQEEALASLIEAIGVRKYDVLAVYGGGNLAPYEPTDAFLDKDVAENEERIEAARSSVYIYGCDLTSIKQVYGGGNAASTPANYLRVNAAYEIDELFGGGNGKDNYTKKEGGVDKTYENPGANVGYKNFTHPVWNAGTNIYEAIVNKTENGYLDASIKETRQLNYGYGSGIARTEIVGGRIHDCYGGSNKKGNIRQTLYSAYQESGACDMIIDNNYGASKEAEIDGEIVVVMDCVSDGGNLYGGAKDAIINNDITLNITNGTFDNIYGGNNISGRINGSITINVQENGCTPIFINKLYGGGNEAPYSIYGFYNAGTDVLPNWKVRTKEKFETDKAAAIAALGENPTQTAIDNALITAGLYGFPKRDPHINIISASWIGSIFGGGYGATADIEGSTYINVNMENGMVLKKFVDKDTESNFTEGTHTVGGKTYKVENIDGGGNAILAIGSIDNIYGGGELGDIHGDTHVDIGTGTYFNNAGEEVAFDPARNAAKITGNVFGGGKGEALESGDRAFYCEAAMVGIDGDGEANPAGGTSVIIGNGTIGTLDGENKLVEGTGNVYGGGEVGRVEKNTVVTIGVEGATEEDTKFKPTIRGSVFGAGKGVATHGYSALVRGNSTVTIQGKAKVGESVYGGGEIASVGRYKVKKGSNDPEGAPDDVAIGMPYSLLSDNSGKCTVVVRDDAEIGPDNMTMFHVDGSGNIVANDQPDNSGHVFGAGKGAMPGVYTYSGTSYPYHMTLDNSGNSVWETIANESAYLTFIETLGLATQTDVTIGGNAFVKGDVFGGAEQGFVQHDTKVTIEGDCQIGNGYVQMADDGTYLANPLSVNRRYTTTEWSQGKLIMGNDDRQALKDLVSTTNYTSSLPECASWLYGQASGTGKYAAHDIYANSYDSKGGSTTGDNGSTFYGNVFGGGSGYFSYAPGKWHWKAGDVGGNTVVDIKGGHILTNVYGGNELTNVAGKCTVNMSGGTIGVPRTLGQIAAHPVTCYLFGGGKGDPRVLFNKQTNVQDVEVNINGGWIYGSAFGGGEDGHVLGNVTMNIQNSVDETDPENPITISSPKIGTWGTSYVDGNIFGGGRGFAGDAYTAGNVAGSINLNIKGGTMLGSVYGGGRLGSVGYGLYETTETDKYGTMRPDNLADDGTTAIANFKRGYVTINITGGTIGNTNEFIVPQTSNIPTGLDADFKKWTTENWTTWKKHNHVPNTTYDTSNGRLLHTKGGNIYAGGMGRYYQLDGTTPISIVDWWKLGNVKSTNLTISGDNTWIMGDVYGGGELGAVRPYTDETDVQGGTTTISITGGTIGTEITGSTPVKATVPVPENGNSNVIYTYGSVYGGGEGQEMHDANENHGGEVSGSTTVDISGDAKIRASVYGGGEMSLVGGDTYVTISGGEIGRNEVKAKNSDNPGYVMFGGETMGNVYGGGKGSMNHYHTGQVKGNTNVTIQDAKASAAYAAAHDGVSEGDVISSPKIYHMVYGGGALASVGTFDRSDGNGHPAYIPMPGIPYQWKYTNGDDINPAQPQGNRTPTGTATVNITGGTIGISGRDNGLVFGSSRGGLSVPVGVKFTQEEIDAATEGQPAYGKTTDDWKYPPMDPCDNLAWVYKSVVNIGTAGSGTDYKTPLIKGSVYGGGENGHNYSNATVNIYSGSIGVPDKNPATGVDDPWWDLGKGDTFNEEVRSKRGNVYGAGSGEDTYKDANDKEHFNARAGMVGGSTIVNIAGGHIGRSVYGGGAMSSVGNITNGNDTIASAKHADEATSFALSWPYKFQFAPNTGRAIVNVTGGHIGTKNIDGGDVYGSSRGKAGDRYATAHLAYVNETVVNINYTNPPEEDKTEEEIENDYSIPCVTGSVHGSGEDGYVYGNARVTLNKGLIGHSVYGAGKGKGTYKLRLLKIGATEGSTTPSDYYDADVYSLIAGKVMGNTYVTMNGGRVHRNVYGGGNMASVGKGNYAGGEDDYSTSGYGEKIDGNLWTSSTDGDNAWQFLNSGKTTVNIISGTVGYIDPTNPGSSVKNNLPYGNVFGGCTGVAAPNISETPRYHYCPAFFSGYVNETDVTIGGYRCNTAYGEGQGAHAVGDLITAEEYQALTTANQGNWELTGPTILASVYGGGQDGHVRRDTKVTVNKGEIGLAYDKGLTPASGKTLNVTLLQTDDLDNDQWVHRGNVYGSGSGISKYEYDFNYDKDFDDTGIEYGTIPGTDNPNYVNERDYSNSAGSVTRFTEVNINGGIIHRNVYGGGSNASVGAPKIDQDYDPYKKDDTTEGHSEGKQSMCSVTIKGTGTTIGTPDGYNAATYGEDGFKYNQKYGGEVYGASRGIEGLGEKFASTIWTKVHIMNGTTIMGNVFGGGDTGIVKKDTEVIVGD